MIEHVADAVRPLVTELLISSRSPDDVPEGVADRFVLDRFPGCGPLAGIHAGLLEASSPWVVAVACDMPYLTVVDLEKIVASASDAVSAVVAVDGEGMRHPLCACYHRSLLPVVERKLSSGDYSVRGLLEEMQVVDVPLSNRALRNVNTVSDLLY